MNGSQPIASLGARAVAATPAGLATRVRGLSDTAIAWLFITPTMLLLLAINLFPLIWTIQLSFTNYRANRPNAPVRTGYSLRSPTTSMIGWSSPAGGAPTSDSVAMLGAAPISRRV